MALRPGYKQTEVGVIPKDWDAIPLATITSEIGDGIHMTPFYSATGDYYFINGNNLRDGKIVITLETKTVDHSEFKKYRKNLDNQSVLMSINGTIGNLGLFAGESLVLGKSAAYLNVKDSVSKLFVYLAMQTESVRRQFSDGLTGSTIRNLGLGTIRSTTIALPPTKAEQEAIAEALSDADALIESLDQLIAKKRDLKQGAMQELLTGKKRLPGFSGEWAVQRLGDLADMGSGGTPPSSNLAYYDGNIPWVAISDMTKGGKYLESTERNLSVEGLINSAAQMFPVGTVLYAMYASLGECSIATVPLSSSQAILGIRTKQKLSGEFLYYFLQSIKPLVKTMGQQGTQTNLNKRMVQDFSLSLPPHPGQTAIATILSDMDIELAELQSRLAKARLIKQGMMWELLTGRIRLL